MDWKLILNPLNLHIFEDIDSHLVKLYKQSRSILLCFSTGITGTNAEKNSLAWVYFQVSCNALGLYICVGKMFL